MTGRVRPFHEHREPTDLWSGDAAPPEASSAPRSAGFPGERPPVPIPLGEKEKQSLKNSQLAAADRAASAIDLQSAEAIRKKRGLTPVAESHTRLSKREEGASEDETVAFWSQKFAEADRRVKNFEELQDELERLLVEAHTKDAALNRRVAFKAREVLRLRVDLPVEE